MGRKIFINLPVKDLNLSMHFYSEMGFTNNPQFSDESAKCMVLSDEIFVMLLSHERFASFIVKPITDVKSTTPLLLSLETESVAAMNLMAEKALAAGGTEPIEAKDHGFMQQRTLEDLDGHIWEVFYMDMSQFPIQENQA
jgi:predicted lactoylglutathione lyase